MAGEHVPEKQDHGESYDQDGELSLQRFGHGMELGEGIRRNRVRGPLGKQGEP